MQAHDKATQQTLVSLDAICYVTLYAMWGMKVQFDQNVILSKRENFTYQKKFCHHLLPLMLFLVKTEVQLIVLNVHFFSKGFWIFAEKKSSVANRSFDCFDSYSFCSS